MVARSGPPEAMLCPAAVCDVCGEPIHGHGHVVWWPEYSDQGEYSSSPLYFVHQAVCDQRLCAALGDSPRHPSGGSYWQSLDEFLAQLRHNFEDPFEDGAAVKHDIPKVGMGGHRRPG